MDEKRSQRSGYAARHHGPEQAPARLVAGGSGGSGHTPLGVGQPGQPSLNVADNPNLVAERAAGHVLREQRQCLGGKPANLSDVGVVFPQKRREIRYGPAGFRARCHIDRAISILVGRRVGIGGVLSVRQRAAQPKHSHPNVVGVAYHRFRVTYVTI